MGAHWLPPRLIDLRCRGRPWKVEGSERRRSGPMDALGAIRITGDATARLGASRSASTRAIPSRSAARRCHTKQFVSGLAQCGAERKLLSIFAAEVVGSHYVRFPPFPAYRRSRRLGLQTARNSRMHQREVRSSNPLCSTRKSARAVAVSLLAKSNRQRPLLPL